MLHTKAILHRKDEEIRAHDCVVSAVVELPKAEFLHFQQNLLQDYPFIKEHVDDMFVDGDVSHCLLVMGEGCEDGVLVRSEGYDYARYSALLPHARSILEAQNLSVTLKDLNQKLTDFAAYAAGQADNQLTRAGHAELPFADMSHAFDLDLFDNKTLYNTTSSMVAEHLNAWDLEFDTDKNLFVMTDYDIQNIIEVSEKRIPFDPLVAPSDQEWGVRRVTDVEELTRQFEHGNWAARTGFVLDDLAFVQQISGGDEWLALKRGGNGWCNFESISFEHMIERNGVEHCKRYIESLVDAPTQEQFQQLLPTLESSVSSAELFEQIARKNCSVDTLAVRNSDSLDFYEVSVWGLKSALEEAYNAGMSAQSQRMDTPEQQADLPEVTQGFGPTLGM